MTEFTGFPQPGYTAIPNELLDTFLPILGEAELRVALFAQELRTPMPVSVKRLQKIWEARAHG